LALLARVADATIAEILQPVEENDFEVLAHFLARA
jgi:hypothetical protein